MIDLDIINSALNGIAMRFEGQYQAHDSCSDGGGWGQFLDGPRPHRQIGLYGTSAGLLVLSLADRDETPCTVGATNLLSAWWQERDTGYGKSKFCQNSRLAFFALCLRNTPNEVAKRMSQEVEKELINRISSRGKWGDYWVKKNVQDISPRYFATALSTLSLSILLLATEQVQPHLEQACAFLRQTLSTNPHLTTTERGLLAAAILAGSGSAQNRKVFKIFNDLARQPEDTLSQHHTYPFEYIYMEPDSSSFVWNRDSVYLYSELMTGIAGFLPKAPTALRLRAESILKQVLNNISSEGGSFRPLQGGRISSVEQAWCSVFLALAKLQAEHRTHGWRKIHYALVRQRQSSTFNDKILPLSAIMVTALISALPLSSISFTIAKVLGSLAIFGLYGETIIKRIFPGR